MDVSVIIPVYNADRFLEKAVNSALQQEETFEVILIEDNSPDNSFEICKQLERDNLKVRLFRHEGGKNKGAGASRNLGLVKAKGEYICFLDADDFMLKNRFQKAKIILENNPDCDGVYDAVGTYF